MRPLVGIFKLSTQLNGPALDKGPFLPIQSISIHELVDPIRIQSNPIESNPWMDPINVQF